MSRRLALFTSAAFLLAACSSDHVSLPANGAYDLAGQYTGTATDSALGSGTASTTLAETGSTLSGTVTLLAASGASLTQNVTWTIGSNYALSGTTTIPQSGGGSCTFASSGQYSTSTFAITGSYTATSGCTGETGTFTLTQQCTNPATPAESERRILTRPTSC